MVQGKLAFGGEVLSGEHFGGVYGNSAATLAATLMITGVINSFAQTGNSGPVARFRPRRGLDLLYQHNRRAGGGVLVGTGGVRPAAL